MLRLCQPEPLQLTLRGLPGTHLLLSVWGRRREGVGEESADSWSLLAPADQRSPLPEAPASPSGFSGPNDAILWSLPHLGPPSSIPGQEPFSPWFKMGKLRTEGSAMMTLGPGHPDTIVRIQGSQV